MAEIYAAEFGISKSYIMKITRDVRPRRKRRSDAKTKRVQLTDAQMLHLLGQVKRNGASAEAAVAAAIDPENKDLSFYIEPENAPTPQTVNAWLRNLNLGYRQRKQVSSLSPYTHRQATRANEVWFFDGTVAEQFYFSPEEDSFFWADPTDRKQPDLPRAVILSVVDGHSRTVYMEAAFHESAVSLCHFIKAACSEKTHKAEFPFMGLPDEIYADPGPAIKSKKFKTFAAAMKINVIPHPPKEPWKKGIVERMFRTVIDRQKLRKQAPKMSRREFGNFLYRWCLWYNNRNHSTTGEAPFDRWVRSVESGEANFRAAPPEALSKFLEFDLINRRLEPDGTVKVNNRRFFIGRRLQTKMGNLVGVKDGTEVAVDPRDKDVVYVIFENEAHKCTAQGIIPRKQFEGAGRPPKMSEREIMLKRIESKETKEILETVKGVGVPLAGKERELTREPISFKEQLEKTGGPAREAIDQWDAREALVSAGFLGEMAELEEITEALLSKLLAIKTENDEPLYRDEIADLIRKLEELEEKGLDSPELETEGIA